MEHLEHNPDFHGEFYNIVNDASMIEAENEITQYFNYDTYLNMELSITRYGDGPEFYWVTRGLRENNGMLIEKSSENPILDIQMYELEYLDGQ